MKRVNYDGTWQKLRGYSPMVSTEGGRILWLSGHVGASEASGGWGFANDFETQARQTFLNIAATLARAGGKLENVVSMTAFVIDAKYCEEFIAIRKEYFPEDNYPCSALIVVSAFAKPAIMIEVQTVAVVPE